MGYELQNAPIMETAHDLDATTARRAMRVVAGNASDPDEAREFLDALGLM